MLEERLQSPSRVPGATFLSAGKVRGYRLRFHKRSKDNSGKCNIIKTDSNSDVVYGVVFEFPDDQLDALDRAEGVGHGYHHECNIPVQFADGTEARILAYIADTNAIDEALIPYAWYYRLVIAGAKQHQLPDDYIADLQAFPYSEDSDSDRATKREAEEQLKAYYSKLRA